MGQHYARTRIDAGKDKDGKLRVFEVGQAVTGLPDDEIKQLAEAGALSDKPLEETLVAQQPPAPEPTTPENTRTRAGR